MIYIFFILPSTSCDPPCVPYLGMYLSDLAFIEEGTPNYTEDNLVNFSKMRMVRCLVTNNGNCVGKFITPVTLFVLLRFLTSSEKSGSFSKLHTRLIFNQR